ncbi:MAG: azurin [Chromatiaceae bacterium]|nr:MAG: azurin [Chromatiaceae bacterium]
MPLHRPLSAALGCLATAQVAAATCDFSVEVNDSMSFPIAEMVAGAHCETITVALEHSGQLPKETMGHNWTLARAADLQAIAIEGMGAGIENDYIKPDDPRVIAHTRIIGSGESDRISFSPAGLSTDEDYRFFCSFPGHWAVMTGRFVLQ